MYPELFRIPVLDWPISTFGVMMACGFLASWWIVGKRFEEHGMDPELSSTIVLYAALGGIVGSKLYFAIDVGFVRGQGEFMDLLLDRAGITWYGGLLGGILATTIGTRVHEIPTRLVASAVAAAAPFGQALGRVGCFLVGDDYGGRTKGWWAVSFPDPKAAMPTIDPVTREIFTVHATQLYEVAWLVPVGIFLWSRRKKSNCLFGEYLMLAAIGRFAIEFVRVNPEAGLGLTSAQWIGIGLFASGAALWVYYRDKPEPVPPHP